MFCDLVDSTPLSSQLDPEDFRAIVAAYQAGCADVIQHYEGSIAQYLGDGLLVYFGYPTAHEDDARRAVRAGLGILDALTDLNRRLERERGVRLSLRLGVHTGLVVVGAIGRGERRERLALGETPNLAARVQSVAEPDTLVVTDATAKLVAGYFEFGELRAPRLKGISEPVAVRRVMRESGVESRLETGGRLTPIVGRESELALLLEGWERVKAGKAGAFLLSGEAGIGKSRLVQVLKERVAAESHTRLECRGSPYFHDTALHPLIELLQRLLGLKEGQDAEGKLARLEEFLRPYPLPLDETTLLFATLLSIPVPEKRFELLPLTPQAQRQRTLASVLRLLVEEAKRGPVLFVVEDLHWIDASTRELLNTLLSGTDAPIQTVVTTRPTLGSAWQAPASVVRIELGPLERQHIGAMVESIAGGKSLPDELCRQLAQRSDGVPLFVEEMTKAVLGSGLLQETAEGYELRAGTAEVGIPVTLQDPLMARLDQQTTAKGAAQLGAAIGRSFSYELMRALWPHDEASLERELGRLVRAELLQQSGVLPDATFHFKHALIQQAAYESLLRSTRQQYHRDIARTLEGRSEEVVRSQPEILAHHHTQAGQHERAAQYWQRAGERALERSANAEAMGHFRRGLELLEALPQGPTRSQLELRLLLGLAVPLTATTGYTTREVEEVFARVQALCREVGETPELFTALRGLRTFHQLRGDSARAQEIAEQILTLARRLGDPALLMEASVDVGAASFWIGEFAAAQPHFDRVIELYDPEKHHEHAFLYGTDPGVQGLGYSSWNLWFLGQIGPALKRSEEAAALARTLRHPFSEAFALVYAACLHYFRRDAPAALRSAEEGIEVARKQGLLWWLALGTIVRGWALVVQGRAEEAVPQIRFCLDRMRAMGTELSRAIFLSMLAEAQQRKGDAKEAFACLEEAALLMEKREQRSYEAVLVLQTRGELLLAVSDTNRAEAERCFEQALRTARGQQARSLQLRSALSLARLRLEGDRAAARELLAEALLAFPESAESGQLREARELLAGLGG
jgi:predicted ATPase/class 3 adenylate cyclase